LTALPPIPEQDLEFQFVRAAGPGGQNVNKVATAAQLRFDLAGTRALTAQVKARLRVLAGRRITTEGDLLIIARNQRTQEGNRREALARLTQLIARASVEPIVRKATRPTHGSKLRRLDSKRERKRTKQLRGRIGSD
jgi:ribosome-associated protein